MTVSIAPSLLNALVVTNGMVFPPQIQVTLLASPEVALATDSFIEIGVPIATPVASLTGEYADTVAIGTETGASPLFSTGALTPAPPPQALSKSNAAEITKTIDTVDFGDEVTFRLTWSFKFAGLSAKGSVTERLVVVAASLGMEIYLVQDSPII
ncbi:MAG: hypothetical protein WC100_04165 [Sterolibacterium sp.]